MEFDLDKIKRVITQKYGWEEPANWTNFHFEELSQAIESETGDRISKETLRRIFGKRKTAGKRYVPQAYSKLTLLNFVEKINVTEQPQKRRIADERFRHLLWRKNKLLWIIPFGILLLIIVAYVKIPRQLDYNFYCVNPQDKFPYTATFRYDVSSIKDSVFTDFGNGEETYLPRNKSMINYFYKYPANYKVRFYTRTRILDRLNVFAWSKEWVAGYHPNEEPKIFRSFSDQEFYRQPTNFYASVDDLLKEGVDIKENYWTIYRYFFPFEQSLDGVTLNTRFLNNASTGSLTCYDTGIMLVGENGTIEFKFTQEKCARWVSLRVSEKFIDGKYNDLSVFTVDMSDWHNVKMTTQNHNCTIYLNNKLIRSQNYDCELGKLLGIVYQFYGSGKIDQVTLSDSTGNVFYSNNFERNSVAANTP
ncbi:hypothetical protein [uncultured Draconibacterium sp.]|uniref:hypothetical protein n=1 Tax=uncultured Draconibacterium sp. TaxID=1573823 RepID=UPI0029C6B7AE|nr:hypothetical protein [uncultured Draconibacterium sp.]